MSEVTLQLKERASQAVSVTIRTDKTVDDLAAAYLAAKGDSATDPANITLVQTGRKLQKTATVGSLNTKQGSIINALLLKPKSKAPSVAGEPSSAAAAVAPPAAPIAPTATAGAAASIGEETADYSEARANLIGLGFLPELVDGALAMAGGNPDVAYSFLARPEDEEEAPTGGRRQVQLTADELVSIFSELDVGPETRAVLESVLENPSQLTTLLDSMDADLREEFLRRVDAHVTRTAMAEAEGAAAGAAGPSADGSVAAPGHAPVSSKEIEELATILDMGVEEARRLVSQFGDVQTVINRHFGDQ